MAAASASALPAGAIFLVIGGNTGEPFVGALEEPLENWALDTDFLLETLDAYGEEEGGGTTKEVRAHVVCVWGGERERG